jgi:predicted DNA-binding helix-hairpin-helix protein
MNSIKKPSIIGYPYIARPLSVEKKLSILSQDSQYDLACACGSSADDRRKRSDTGDRWIYPVTLPDGGRGFLLKTLLSNACVNDCGYCPLRADTNAQRCTLEPEQVARMFLHYYRSKRVFGLFVSSGVCGSPDSSMQRLIETASILRKREHFKGYIHLKIIPGASDTAIEEALKLASTVSLNIETAGAPNFSKLSKGKDYLRDIIRPIQTIGRLTAKGAPYSRVKHTTQFVVGASTETDRELLSYCGGLYDRLHLQRIYFSAYQRGLGRPDLPGEQSTVSSSDLLTREHRLYQVDFLLRKYRFSADEIPLDSRGFLSLTTDPKQLWARAHPGFFPVNVNKADKWELLRVPGLGHQAVGRILATRKDGRRVNSLENVGTVGKVLGRAREYVCFG